MVTTPFSVAAWLVHSLLSNYILLWISTKMKLYNLLFDNAAIRRRWGGGSASCSLVSKRSAITSTSQQAYWAGLSVTRPPHITEDGCPQSVNWGEKFKLNYQRGKQPLHAYCRQCMHIPISRNHNGDMRARTRIHFDNQFFYYRLTCLLSTNFCSLEIVCLSCKMCLFHWPNKKCFAVYSMLWAVGTFDSWCVLSVLLCDNVHWVLPDVQN